MLVSEQHKALVLRTRFPDKLLTTLPRAKQLNPAKPEYVAIPHRVEEVRVLRNMGYSAPSPIKSYYEWPRSHHIKNPFDAQVETAAFLTYHNRAYVLSGMGAGKTNAVLWAFDYLRSQGLVNRMLVVAPLSTLELTWGNALFDHFPHLDSTIVHHSNRQKRIALLNQEADVYITNHDGPKIIGEALAARPDIDLIVVDEVAQCARNKQTDRWKALNEIINKQKAGKKTRACWGLTGTPVPNEPTDAYAQAKLVTPETVPRTVTKFRDMVMKQVGPYLWVPRQNAMDTVYDALKPAIRYSREECVDLPPTTFSDQHAELTAKQHKAYKAMRDTLRSQIEAGEITAANEAVKLGKLVQIACGMAYGANGDDVIDIGAKPREELTSQLVKDAAGKAIVFVPFVASIQRVEAALQAQGFSTGVVHGKVSSTARNALFQRFQHGDDLDVLVAQPAAMSHGLTLTAASTIIWYAPITSSDTYEQANARITRPGQTHNTLIVNVSGTAEERRIYDRLKRRQKVQNILLDKVVAGRAA